MKFPIIITGTKNKTGMCDLNPRKQSTIITFQSSFVSNINIASTPDEKSSKFTRGGYPYFLFICLKFLKFINNKNINEILVIFYKDGDKSPLSKYLNL